jgi:hypothetical protein
MIKTILTKWKRSKTVVFGLLVALLGGVQTYLPNVDHLFAPSTYGVITFTVGMVIIVLRFYTTKPLDDK